MNANHLTAEDCSNFMGEVLERKMNARLVWYNSILTYVLSDEINTFIRARNRALF